MSVHSASAPGRLRPGVALVALLILIATVSTALVGLFEGPGWWFLAQVTATLTLVSAALLRRFLPAWCASVGGLVVAVAFAFLLFAVAPQLVAVPPELHPVQRLRELFEAAVQQIQTGAVPVVPSTALMLLVTLGTAALATAMDMAAFVLRRPALAGLPALAMAVFPALVPRARLEPWSIVLALAGYLTLLAVTRHPRFHRPRLAIGMAGGAAAVVVAVAVGLTAPGFAPHGTTADALSRLAGAPSGSSVSSLIDLGKDLHRPTSVPVLSYTTTATDGLYLTLTTLGTFTGDTWTRSPQGIRPLGVDGEVGEIPGLSGGVPKASVRTTVTIDDLHSAWIPAPYPAVRITGLEGRWDVGTRDLTIGADGSATEGQRYTVQSSRIVPTSSQLAHASTLYPAEVRPELALPGPIPKNIIAAAQKATRGAKTDYQKAVDLEAYFRDGDFSYSLQTPLKQGYEGDGLAVISKFLQVKSGYCVHFASAMAIMARVLGIPARVAIGYLPGIGTPELSGRTVYTVTSDQLHSWPELYFSGIGWVRFEPTVSLGTIPSYAVAPAGPDTATADPLAPQSTQPTPTSALPPQTANGTTDVAETAPLASGRLNIAALSVIALLVLLLPAVAGMLRRVLHRARLAWGAAPAGSAWQAVSEYAVDLRRVRARQGRTIRRLAAELRLDGARAALLRLRDQAERERYGPDASGGARRELSADLGEVTRALRRDAGPRRRLAALLAPVSLVPASGRPRRGDPEVSASPGHMTSHSRTILGREHRPTVPVPPRRP